MKKSKALGTAPNKGFSNYPAEDDIYNRLIEDQNIDPESTGNLKSVNTDNNIDPILNGQNMTTEDLDIPGAEMDDPAEIIGCEDEENNAYSLSKNYLNDPEEDSGE